MAHKGRDRAHRGYQYPNPIDGYPLIDVCLQIPDHELYRAAFRGQMALLYKWWSWYNDDVNDPAQRDAVAEQWLTVVNDSLQGHLHHCKMLKVIDGT